MFKSSCVVVYIPTLWPIERQRILKTNQELAQGDLDDDSVNIWKLNWFDKYENRSSDLGLVNLAIFVANYTVRPNNTYSKRKEPRIIRYRNYDMGTDLNEYKREMVTLYLPLRIEENDILSGNKYITLYNENEDQILQKRKEFESDLDIGKTIEICRQMCIDIEN